MAEGRLADRYRVEIHEPETDKTLGEWARVDYNMTWAPDRRATLSLTPKYGPDADRNARPAYGLGRSLIEHEENHIQDYVTIFNRRRPGGSVGPAEYDDYMKHTLKLLKTCSEFHTDQISKPKDPLWNECKRILNWK